MPAHFFCWVTGRPKLSNSMDRQPARVGHALRWARSLVSGFLMVMGSSGTVAARQALSAAGVQDLSFGAVFPGINSRVLRSDRVRSGRLMIRGSRRAEVAILLTLPRNLVSPSGARLRLRFRRTDGGYSRRPGRRGRAFDPRNPLVTRLSRRGRLYLSLGGTVRPRANQAPGLYRATITLTVSYTGN